MGDIFRGIVLGVQALAVGAFLGACSNNQPESSGEERPEVQGVIVRNLSESQLAQLSESKGVELRRLYGGAILLSGMSEEAIQQEYPLAETQLNYVFKNLIPKPRKLNLEEVSEFDFSQCQDLPGAPVPVVEVKTSSPTMQELKLIDLKDVKDGGIEFSAKGSRSQAEEGGSLEITWMVMGPHHSKYEEVYFKGESLVLEPDLTGEYFLGLILKDERSVCSGITTSFGVTKNEKLKAPNAMPQLTSAEASLFDHLPAVKAKEAWAKSTGKDVVIAVLDTGVNYNHPDLGANIFINRKEIPGNGIDDDNNSLVDDAYGWDFILWDPYAFDDAGHGTHVAGIAASTLTGVAPGAKILPIKVLDARGSGSVALMDGAIRYATDMGADIINLSLGHDNELLASLVSDAMNYAEDHGVLVVAAAGNGDEEGNGYDITSKPWFPASHPNNNIVSVAATGLDGTLTSYSNFSSTLVDIAAPGGINRNPIYAASHTPQFEKYVGFSGTSMATPVTSGVLALILGANKDLGLDAKNVLLATAQPKGHLFGLTLTGGMVDAQAAVDTAYSLRGVEFRAR